GRDRGGGAAKHELEIVVGEWLRLEPGGAPDPRERVVTLAQAVAQRTGGDCELLARSGLPAQVAEGAAQDRCCLAVCFVPRLEEFLKVLVQIGIRLVGRRLLGIHATTVIDRATSRPRRVVLARVRTWQG